MTCNPDFTRTPPYCLTHRQVFVPTCAKGLEEYRVAHRPDPAPAPEGRGAFEEGRAAGVNFYADPEALTEAQVDPPLWPAVRRVNRSGWVWTAESCQGHPDAADGEPWVGNVRPMLRLACRWADRGRMLAALHDASVYVRTMRDPEGAEPLEVAVAAWGLQVWPHPKPARVVLDGEVTSSYRRPLEAARDWCEVLVYVEGVTTAWARNEAVRVFDRFADLVAEQTPDQTRRG